MLPPEQRAELIGTLYREAPGRPSLEFLMDLEADRAMGLIVADVLKAMDGPQW